jgi:hypothetical protein
MHPLRFDVTIAVAASPNPLSAAALVVVIAVATALAHRCGAVLRRVWLKAPVWVRSSQPGWRV